MTQLVYSQPPLATWVSPPGADDGTRTRNLLFTKQLLYQLSYAGTRVRTKSKPSSEGYSLTGSVSIHRDGEICPDYYRCARRRQLRLSGVSVMVME